jgi:hypothetical protein
VVFIDPTRFGGAFAKNIIGHIEPGLHAARKYFPAVCQDTIRGDRRIEPLPPECPEADAEVTCGHVGDGGSWRA